MARPLSLCTFRLADQVVALPALRIQEVVRVPRITPVPLAPPAVLGLINLRGQVVAAVDLRRRLDLPPVELSPDREPRGDAETGAGICVVVETVDGLASLLVDDIGDVVEIDEARILPLPATLRGAPRALANGVLPLDATLVLVLDVDRAGVVPSSEAA
ncbi:chemotaxis protein CheW [Myxococcota bacterium]|nr:chemotaxis protein CheW [Myxococcota bacterium]